MNIYVIHSAFEGCIYVCIVYNVVYKYFFVAVMNYFAMLKCVKLIFLSGISSLFVKFNCRLWHKIFSMLIYYSTLLQSTLYFFHV